ncbi:hypothetical protein H7J06_24185 [Mycobacterium hodleri]|uniref:hypothetical protein n=1 Tax=Mycolicibacterium hodleri TaxID=49897 RepID=UPI0021F2B535|nr:hypothetical protein [Mycolicibacterium hodleri]MCV7136076.1 hypothetical protein [Mycolicibacterium hodleri]
MRRVTRYAAVVLCSAALTMAPAGAAHADCTGAGDFGAGSGCPPPGDSGGSGGGDSWPPTSVDWPPAQSSSSGDSDGGDAHPPATPIVLPFGQAPPPPAHPVTSTTPTPTPIVPVAGAS